MTDEDLDALAAEALAADFNPVPWDEAPEWRRVACRAVAKAAVGACGVSRCEIARSAWTLSMTLQGWKWGPVLDEAAKQHPGIVFGDLTRGGIAHWSNVVDRIRAVGRARGVRLTGE